MDKRQDSSEIYVGQGCQTCTLDLIWTVGFLVGWIQPGAHGTSNSSTEYVVVACCVPEMELPLLPYALCHGGSSSSNSGHTAVVALSLTQGMQQWGSSFTMGQQQGQWKKGKGSGIVDS